MKLRLLKEYLKVIISELKFDTGKYERAKDMLKRQASTSPSKDKKDEEDPSPSAEVSSETSPDHSKKNEASPIEEQLFVQWQKNVGQNFDDTFKKEVEAYVRHYAYVYKKDYLDKGKVAKASDIQKIIDSLNERFSEKIKDLKKRASSSSGGRADPFAQAKSNIFDEWEKFHNGGKLPERSKRKFTDYSLKEKVEIYLKNALQARDVSKLSGFDIKNLVKELNKRFESEVKRKTG